MTEPSQPFPRAAKCVAHGPCYCHGFFTSTRDDAGLRAPYIAALIEVDGGQIMEVPATWITLLP